MLVCAAPVAERGKGRNAGVGVRTCVPACLCTLRDRLHLLQDDSRSLGLITASSRCLCVASSLCAQRGVSGGVRRGLPAQRDVVGRDSAALDDHGALRRCVRLSPSLEVLASGLISILRLVWRRAVA